MLCLWQTIILLSVTKCQLPIHPVYEVKFPQFHLLFCISTLTIPDLSMFYEVFFLLLCFGTSLHAISDISLISERHRMQSHLIQHLFIHFHLIENNCVKKLSTIEVHAPIITSIVNIYWQNVFFHHFFFRPFLPSTILLVV